MWPNPQLSTDLVKFTEEVLNGKLPFLCIVTFSEKEFVFSTFFSVSGNTNTTFDELRLEDIYSILVS